KNVRAIIENNKELEVVKIFKNRSDLEALPTFSVLYHSSKRRNHEFSLWRSDDKPILIENEKMSEQKMNYIHLNPVRKGYVEAINDYPFSSASEYGKSLIPLDELKV
ncbi:MAG: hypothetical protein GWO85_01745, partial [Simkaniaceae bacterium]|nr:hypothetical protein [Simkaniaceae bacterium]